MDEQVKKFSACAYLCELIHSRRDSIKNALC